MKASVNNSMASKLTKKVDNVEDSSNTSDKDAKFKQWLLNKSIRERAIELLGKLDESRCDDESDLRDVAIALCAADHLLERAAVGDDAPIDGIQASKSVPRDGPKPLRTYWMRWAMEHHTFNMVELNDDEVSKFSEAVKEYLDTSEPGKTILPSLKYFFPAVPKKPNEKVKPLTNDQKLQNNIYLREMKRVWKNAKKELIDRLREYVARREQQSTKGSSSSMNSAASRARLETQALNEMSLKQLNTWVEEDEDKAAKRANDDEQDRIRTSKVSHEQWVKNKDRFVTLPMP